MMQTMSRMRQPGHLGALISDTRAPTTTLRCLKSSRSRNMFSSSRLYARTCQTVLFYHGHQLQTTLGSTTSTRTPSTLSDVLTVGSLSLHSRPSTSGMRYACGGFLTTPAILRSQLPCRTKQSCRLLACETIWPSATNKWRALVRSSGVTRAIYARGTMWTLQTVFAVGHSLPHD
jgi:hypothetical protein